jgi:hypothetical protein
VGDRSRRWGGSIKPVARSSQSVVGKRRGEFIEGSAGDHRTDRALGARSDLDPPRVMCVLNTTIGVTAVQTALGRPRIESKASLPRHDGPNKSMHAGLPFPQMLDQLREAGVWDAGDCKTAFPGPSALAAAGGLGRAGMHLATSTVRSSIPKPIAIARSQAFNSPAIRSRRRNWCFIGDLALIPRLQLTYTGYVAMQHENLVNLC